jgi:hypothetical protein
MDNVRNVSGRARRAVVATLAVLSVVAGGVSIGSALTAAPAQAATSHRAAVVIYVNGAVHTAKVTFTGDSISGLAALNDAGFAPLVRVFGGNGGAVCALDVGGTTIGCPADNSCLTCAQPDYWAYFRAPAGATSYTYSLGGAGSTHVHDGDVEAWAWGTGSTPTPFVSFTDVWGVSDPPTTTRPTTAPTSPPKPTVTQPTRTTVGAQGPVPTVGSTSVPTTRSLDAASSTTKSSTTKPSGTTKGATSTDTNVVDASRSKRVATAPIVARKNGGSPYGLIGFAAILALLVGAIVWARRRRSAAVETT